MKKLLLAFGLALLPLTANAAAVTYGVTLGSGQNFRAYNDGTAYLGANVTCDPATNTQCLAIDASGGVQVKQESGGIFQVSPTSAANAVGNPFYVNPGTSANFAQETGGNLATVAGAVSASKVNVNISSTTSAALPISATTAANAVGNPVFVAPGTSANFAGAAPMQSTGGTVQPVGGATGGNSAYHKIAAASDNHAVIKAGAGTVYDVDAVTGGTAVQYVRLYDATTAFNGCNSATNLVWGQQVPAPAAAAGVGGGFMKQFPQGVAFATGISICITGAVSDTDTTNAATTTVVNVGYK